MKILTTPWRDTVAAGSLANGVVMSGPRQHVLAEKTQLRDEDSNLERGDHTHQPVHV